MSLDPILELLRKAGPSVATIAAVVAGLWLANRALQRAPAALSEHRFRMQMLMLGLTAVGVLVVILVVPMGDARRGQLLSLLGILLSAAIALSSTTFLGNAMAGVMLRAVGSFRSGDFITCGEHFGRVSERGLFHTEIQTEERSLTTLPNLFLVTNPTTTVRSSGTIVAATCSLGYDVAHDRIEAALLDAAGRAGLEDPFVHVKDLGDFSVTYRIAGMLVDVKTLLSARSNLRRAMLDALHEAGIEIVSPNFMNTRALDPAARVMPERRAEGRATDDAPSVPEAIVFDKAEEAESLEQLRAELKSVVERIEALDGGAGDTAQASGERTAERETLESRRAELVAAIDAVEAKNAEASTATAEEPDPGSTG